LNRYNVELTNEEIAYIHEIQHYAFSKLNRKDPVLLKAYETLEKTRSEFGEDIMTTEEYIIGKVRLTLNMYMLNLIGETLESDPNVDDKINLFSMTGEGLPDYKPYTDRTTFIYSIGNCLRRSEDKIKEVENTLQIESLYHSTRFLESTNSFIDIRLKKKFIRDYLKQSGTPLCTRLNVGWQTIFENLNMNFKDFEDLEREIFMIYLTNLVDYQIFWTYPSMNINIDLFSKIKQVIEKLYVKNIYKSIKPFYIQYTFVCETLNTDISEEIFNSIVTRLLSIHDQVNLNINPAATNILLLLNGFRVRELYLLKDKFFVATKEITENEIQAYDEYIKESQRELRPRMYSELMKQCPESSESFAFLKDNE
jgi:hypothetical protein